MWRDVAARLEAGHHCVVPDLPLGAHRRAMRAGADLSPRGLARLVADLLEALDLSDVTLVGNDTGGAIAQIVAAHHPQRLGRLVLTPCDAYDQFLPTAFRPFQWLGRAPRIGDVALRALRFAPVRAAVVAPICKRPDHELVREWMQPVLADREVRRDLLKVLAGIDSRHTIEAAERLQRFNRPTLLAWAPEDRFFKIAFARRLAADLPNARIEKIHDSRTFVPVDQPARTAELIAEFARAAVAA